MFFREDMVMVKKGRRKLLASLFPRAIRHHVIPGVEDV